MPHTKGYRAGTRDLFCNKFRGDGLINMTTYNTVYKVGDYVDIKCNAKVQKGMPHKFYHGRTGVIYNVTKSSVGVVVNKQVNGRIIKKRVNLRVEHVSHSKCRDELIARVKSNELIKNTRKANGVKPTDAPVVLKRSPVQPQPGQIIKMKGESAKILYPVRYEFVV
jgi:large subunit ribosomal protein L21e